MGFFDFLKPEGDAVIKSDDRAAADITPHIEANDQGVGGLQVGYQAAVVALSGQAQRSETREKAVPMPGNIKEVERLVADDPLAPAATATLACQETQTGETLSQLAQQYCGDARQYPSIVEASGEVVRDPDPISPGHKICFPV